jgi:hypothetical protein
MATDELRPIDLAASKQAHLFFGYASLMELGRQ